MADRQVVSLEAERRQRGYRGPSADLRLAIRDFERALDRLDSAIRSYELAADELDALVVQLSPAGRIVPPR